MGTRMGGGRPWRLHIAVLGAPTAAATPGPGPLVEWPESGPCYPPQPRLAPGRLGVTGRRLRLVSVPGKTVTEIVVSASPMNDSIDGHWL